MVNFFNMTSRIPPLSALKAFEALARLERVNAVAKELHLTHSAVSHQLRGLEEWVGVALFDRRARQLTLTEAGRTYAYQVRQSLDELSQATQKLTKPAHEDVLSIAVFPSFAMHWLVPRLFDFQQTYPNVVLSFHAGLAFIEFEKTRIDGALRFGHGQWPNVQTELIMGDSLVLVASPSLVGTQSFKTLKSLKKYPLLHSGESWSTWLKSALLEDEPPAADMVFTDSTHLLEAAKLGLGIGLTRRSIANNLIQQGLLRSLSPIEPVHSSSYYLVWPYRSKPHPMLKKFRDWLSIQVKQYQTSLR
jgi:LysR family transcriptional regulator, glycine cleavage system transcriptional activator